MIKLLVTDIDGVLTNGKVYLSASGEEMKGLCFQDLDSLSGLRTAAINLAIITGEKNFFTTYVNNRFAPKYMYDACKDKMNAIQEMLAKEHIRLEEIAYIGDGKYDNPIIRAVPTSFCPYDAIPNVRRDAKVVLSTKGGNGCLRETVDYILRMQNESDNIAAIKAGMKIHQQVIKFCINSDELIHSINQAVNCIKDSLLAGGQLLLCGNGGSAADAQHLATELVSRFYCERKALNAEALTVNTSTLTAVGNDYSFERIFARQIEAKGTFRDVLLGISTSGESANVIEAVQSARSMGMETIVFTGKGSSTLKSMADIVISVPTDDTPRIQEMHILIGHIICELVEKELCQEN